MKKIAVLVAVLLSLVGFGLGQTTPLTIKGHHLGESMEEFFRSEPAIQAHLELCQRLRVVDRTYNLAHDQIIAGGPISYDGDPAVEKYVLKDKKGRPRRWDIEALRSDSSEYRTKWCSLVMVDPIKSDGHLLQTLGNSEDVGVSDLEWFFKDGVMYRMSIKARATYEQVRDDFTKRIGVQPISEQPIPKHNAFGATWSDPDAEWLTTDVHAHLSESENPAKPARPRLEIETRAAFNEEVRKMKAQPSPLD